MLKKTQKEKEDRERVFLGVAQPIRSDVTESTAGEREIINGEKNSKCHRTRTRSIRKRCLHFNIDVVINQQRRNERTDIHTHSQASFDFLFKCLL